MSNWHDLLLHAVATEPGGISGVARRIGYSRPAVSRVLAGSYRNPEKVGAAVIAAYSLVKCPFLARGITTTECQHFASRCYQAISSAEVEHWRACRKCQFNPEKKES